MRKYVKRTSANIYFILVILIFSLLFVIYGLMRYMFSTDTSVLIHGAFIISGIVFAFLSVGILLELLESEGIEYIVRDDTISIAKLWFLKGYSLKWNNIKVFNTYKIGSGDHYKRLYILKDDEGQELGFGEELYNVQELVQYIKEKTGIEPVEQLLPEKINIKNFYYFTRKEKDINPYTSGFKVHNSFNIVILLLLLGLSFFMQHRVSSMAEETKRTYFFIQIVIGILLTVGIANFIFYFIQKNRTVTKLSEILLMFINLVVVLFFLSLSMMLIYAYPRFSLVFSNFYVILIVGLIVFVFLALGNTRAILWIVKNIQRES